MQHANRFDQDLHTGCDNDVSLQDALSGFTQVEPKQIASLDPRDRCQPIHTMTTSRSWLCHYRAGTYDRNHPTPSVTWIMESYQALATIITRSSSGIGILPARSKFTHSLQGLLETRVKIDKVHRIDCLTSHFRLSSHAICFRLQVPRRPATSSQGKRFMQWARTWAYIVEVTTFQYRRDNMRVICSLAEFLSTMHQTAISMNQLP